MEETKLSLSLAALGHPIRLAMFRLLVDAGEAGMGPVAIGASMGMQHNLVSYHLQPLVRAGLASSERRGREVDYRVVPDGLVALSEAIRDLVPAQGAGRGSLPGDRPLD